uniref:LPD7 domain-containing protein n=1 Tax=Methylomonas sp. SPW-1 TaxID=3438877 RepID=UPI00402B6DDD
MAAENNTDGSAQDDRQPTESARFWRLNSIEALKMMPRLETNPERFAADEEHLMTMQTNSAKLAELQAREDAVQARYARMRGRSSGKSTDETVVSPKAQPQQTLDNIIEFYDKTQDKTVMQHASPVQEQANGQQTTEADIPDHIANRYLRTKNRYFFPDKTLAFEDNGKKLKLETENITVIRDALAIAESRNWRTITVSGTDNFKQQVWREASIKEIEVIGYKPTELEMAELQKALATKTAKSTAPEAQPKQRVDAIIGKLLAHGADHYKHDPNQGKSYFVKLEVEGQEVTKWGADFKRALVDSQSQPQIGDTVVLSNVGKQSVNIPTTIRDENGNTVETKKPVQKNTWRIEKEDYQTTLEEHAEALRTGKEIEHQVIAQIPQVAAAITAAKLGEKIAEQAHQSGVIKSEDEKATLVYLIREGLASALEKGKKITAPEIKEQGQQAAIEANNVFNDRKPPVMTKEPPTQDMSLSR